MWTHKDIYLGKGRSSLCFQPVTLVKKVNESRDYQKWVLLLLETQTTTHD